MLDAKHADRTHSWGKLAVPFKSTQIVRLSWKLSERFIATSMVAETVFLLLIKIDKNDYFIFCRYPVWTTFRKRKIYWLRSEIPRRSLHAMFVTEWEKSFHIARAQSVKTLVISNMIWIAYTKAVRDSRRRSYQTAFNAFSFVGVNFVFIYWYSFIY